MDQSRGQQREISVEDEDIIWQFVHKELVVKERHSGICSQLWEDYIKKTGASWTVQQMEEYFNEMMVRNLYKADIEPRKIIELYKTLKLPMTEHAETMLETISRAVLRLNRDRLLVSFRCTDTIAKKVTPPQKSVSAPPAELDESVTSPSSHHLVRRPSKIVNWSAPKSTTCAETQRQDEHAETVARDDQLKLPPRVIYRKMSRNQQNSASAEKNDDNDDENDGDSSTECKVAMPVTRRQFDLEEDLSIWRYLYGLVFDKATGRPTGNTVLPKGNTFWFKFIETTKSKRSVANLCSHFRKKMLNELYEMPIEREQILWLHKILNINVPAAKKDRMEKMYKAKIEIRNDSIFSWKLNINEKERQDEDEDEEIEELYDLEKAVSDVSPGKSSSRLQREANNEKTVRKRNRRLVVSSDSSDKSDDETPQPGPTKRRKNALGSTQPLEIPQQDVNSAENVRRAESNERSDPGSFSLELHDPPNDKNSEESSSSTSAENAENEMGTSGAMHPINISGEKEKTVYKKPKLEVDDEAGEVQFVGDVASSDGQQHAEPCQESCTQKDVKREEADNFEAGGVQFVGPGAISDNRQDTEPCQEGNIRKIVKREDDDFEAGEVQFVGPGAISDGYQGDIQKDVKREVDDVDASPRPRMFHFASPNSTFCGSFRNAQSEPEARVDETVEKENTSEENVENTSEANVENTSEGNVENTSEANVENSSEGNVENSSEGNVENTSEGNVENTSEGKVESTSESPIERAMKSLKRAMLKSQFLSNPQELYESAEQAVRDGGIVSYYGIVELKSSLKRLTMDSLSKFRNEKVHEYKARAVRILCRGMEDFPVARKDISRQMIDTILESVRNLAWDRKSYFIMVKASRETFQSSILQLFA